MAPRLIVCDSIAVRCAYVCEVLVRIRSCLVIRSPYTCIREHRMCSHCTNFFSYIWFEERERRLLRWFPSIFTFTVSVHPQTARCILITYSTRIRVCARLKYSILSHVHPNMLFVTFAYQHTFGLSDIAQPYTHCSLATRWLPINRKLPQ